MPARILKICDDSIALPLFLIYKKCIDEKLFPKQWKRANLIPTHKKNEKNLISNYRPISLLPICGKIFEKIILDNLYPYIFKNKFIHDKQSGYRRGDSTVKQLISITDEIYKAFDKRHEVRAIFLDISKAFDKVWKDGLIFKLKTIGIEGEVLNILSSFLEDRQQRVTLDGENSDWVSVEAGVPQGSILGPILFLVYINDLIQVVHSDIRIFADDTFIFRIVNPTSALELTKDLEAITRWSEQWKLEFNPTITKQAAEVLFSNKKIKSILDPLKMNDIPIKQLLETKHLGVTLDNELSFKPHIEEKLFKARSSLGLLKYLKKYVAYDVLENIYKLYTRPNFDYADIVYHKAEEKNAIFHLENNNHLMKQIETVHYEAARAITGAWKGTSREKLYKNLGWESLNQRRIMRKLCIIQETIETKSPNYLYQILANRTYGPDSRSSGRNLFEPIFCDTKTYKLSFFPSTIKDWNKLDRETRESNSLSIFKKRILNKIRPAKASYFGIKDHTHIKYLTMLRLDQSPLRAHKFEHGFLDTTDNLCVACGVKEDTEHFLLFCRSYHLSRSTLMQNVSDIIGRAVSTFPRRTLVNILLRGKEDIDEKKNNLILNCVVDYIIQSKRLDIYG